MMCTSVDTLSQVVTHCVIIITFKVFISFTANTIRGGLTYDANKFDVLLSTDMEMFIHVTVFYK